MLSTPYFTRKSGQNVANQTLLLLLEAGFETQHKQCEMIKQSVIIFHNVFSTIPFTLVVQLTNEKQEA